MGNEFLKYLEQRDNLTKTENGAIAYRSTMNACLDAFGSLGAMRDASESSILNMFAKAFEEDRALAIRILFYMRDIRGGQGMRRVFRIIVRWLAQFHPEYVIENLDNFLYFGRGDDLICLLDTNIVVREAVTKFIKKQLYCDYEAYKFKKPCSLLAKWLPSANASSKETHKNAVKIYKGLGWSEKNYRKLLSLLRKYIDVTEVKMSARQWDKINYSNVPAKASMNYSDAFARHDKEGYEKYMTDLIIGKAKINAGSLFPVDIIHNVNTRGYYASAEDVLINSAMWEALPNYFEGLDETGICMIDTSGSMSGTPYEVAVSLGLYCADKCTGPFKGHFFTFAEHPTFETVSGENIVEKVRNLKCINAGNTDIESAFQMILDTAIATKCKQEDLPAKLYIISDMQFDEARGARYGYGYGWSWDPRPMPTKPFMQTMREKFEHAGYTMPSLVYWNVRASECGMFQQTFEGENCCMVSGYSPSLFKAIIQGTTYEETVNGRGEKTLKANLDPMTVMFTAVGNERYDRVWVG